MPTSYSRSEPYRSSEAWFRMLIGFFIAITLFMLLSPNTNLLDPTLLIPMLIMVVLAGIAGGAATGLENKLARIILALAAFAIIPLILSSLFITTKLPDASPLFFLALAFFATAPKVSKEDEEGEKIIIVGGFGKGTEGIRSALTSDSMERFGSVFFLTLVLASIYPVVAWVRGPLQIVLLIVLAFSGIMGYISGREARPFLGIIVIGFSILAFSFQFTGTVGTAVFGNYWTPIYSTLSTTFEPIGKSLDAASRQVNYAMCTITAGPGVCDALINPPATAAGSTQALELSNFEAVNYRSGNPEIDPSIPLIGTIQMENQGDFRAEDAEIYFNDPIIFDPKKASLNNPGLDQQALESDTCVFDSCFDGTVGATSTGAGKCTWKTSEGKGPLNPKDMKVLSFRCGEKNQDTLANPPTKWQTPVLKTCNCIDPRAGQTMSGISCESNALCGTMISHSYGISGGQQYCKCISSEFTSQDDSSGYCSGAAPAAYCKLHDGLCKSTDDTDCNAGKSGAIKKYASAGRNLKISFNYTFKYFSNVSLPVRVMDRATFLSKLQNHQITLEDVNPVYSGGPVSVGIWVGKQPVRTDEQTIGTIYLKNDGTGVVKKNSALTLAVPAGNLSFAQSNASIISQSFNFRGQTGSNAVSCLNFELVALKNIYVLKCPLSRDLNPGEEGTITFGFKYKINDNAPEKNTIFTGAVDYIYENTKDLSFPLVSVPTQ